MKPDQAQTRRIGRMLPLACLVACTAGPTPSALAQEDEAAVWVRKAPIIVGREPKYLDLTNTSCTYKETRDGKDYTNTLSWEEPPETIREGEPVQLKMWSTDGPWASVGGWWNLRRFTTPAGKEPKGLNGAGSLASWRLPESGGSPHAGTYIFYFYPSDPTGSIDKPYIELSAGHDPAPETWFLMQWVYERAAPGSRPPGGGGTGGAGTGGGLDDRGRALRDRYGQAWLRFRLLEEQRRVYQEVLLALDEQWEAVRLTSYASGVLDVATLAGSAWWKMGWSALGREAIKQTFAEKVIEAAIKAAIKQSLKQFTSYWTGQGVDVKKILDSAHEDAVKKSLVQLLETSFTEGMVKMIQSDWLKRPEAFDFGRGAGESFKNLNTTVKEQWAGPLADFIGNLYSFGKAVNDAWTGHGKLEKIRLIRKDIRENKIMPVELQIDQARQDLDVAKYAWDLYVKDHPEARGGQ